MKKRPKITIRKANFSDIEFLWYLRNQPDLYKSFKNSRPVSWEKHLSWLIPTILGIAPRNIFVIQKSNIPVGQIRIDYKTFDISISILEEFRGKDFAKKALKEAIKKIKKIQCSKTLGKNWKFNWQRVESVSKKS
jgi:RimJ/RimL family protein N-acetyltransferase